MTAFLILIVLGAIAYYYRDIIIPKVKAAWAKINRQ